MSVFNLDNPVHPRPMVEEELFQSENPPQYEFYWETIFSNPITIKHPRKMILEDICTIVETHLDKEDE